MSTQVIPWKERMAALAKRTEDAEKPTGNFITFRAGQMLFNDAPVPGNKLTGVCIDYIFENAYFPDKFNPAKPASPICYAFGRKDSELKPHAECEEPQNTECDGCIRNAWGSDPDGGRGKACKNTRRLAILHQDSLHSEKEILEAAVAFCKIPVTSVRNWSTFANQCSTVLKVPPLAVITEISVVPHPKNQFEVLFKGSGVITDDEILAALVAKQELVAKNIMVPYPKNQKEGEPVVPKKDGKKYS